MPPTTDFEFGEMVLVAFPYTDHVGSKRRPAVVASSDAYNRQRPDVILMAITSQVRRAPGFGEAVIQDWQAAGLGGALLSLYWKEVSGLGVRRHVKKELVSNGGATLRAHPDVIGHDSRSMA
jgi:hypothetical protein